MFARLHSVGAIDTCQPLTCARSLADCPVANQPLREAQIEAFQAAGFRRVGEGVSAELEISGDAWLGADTLRRLAAEAAPVKVFDAAGFWLASIHSPPTAGAAFWTVADSFRIRYPWDLLRVQEVRMAEMTLSAVEGVVSPGVTVDGVLRLGAGSRILPGVYIEGPVSIGRNCKIGPNCYLRGPVSIGDGGVIGQGVEVKNSILGRECRLCHLSYCGDSILGDRVNFGGGTITANVRHDGRPHRTPVGGVSVETGRLKLGAIIGDDVHTGIHTSLYPGRKLWPGVATLPGAVVREDIRS